MAKEVKIQNPDTGQKGAVPSPKTEPITPKPQPQPKPNPQNPKGS